MGAETGSSKVQANHDSRHLDRTGPGGFMTDCLVVEPSHWPPAAMNSPSMGSATRVQDSVPHQAEMAVVPYAGLQR